MTTVVEKPLTEEAKTTNHIKGLITTKNDVASSSLLSLSSSSSSQLYLLPDETLIEILLWLPNAKDCVRWSQTCRRLHRLIQQQEQHDNKKAVLTQLLQSRKIPFLQISTFEQLAWYERVKEYGLLKENRIGFSMASTEIDDDNDDSSDEDVSSSVPGATSTTTTIRANRKRLVNVQRLMYEFRRMHVTVDAHCGTSGPMNLANRFAQARGMKVIDELTDFGASAQRDRHRRRYHHYYYERINYFGSVRIGIADAMLNRVRLHAWGRRISDYASLNGTSTHPHAALARQGKGWVELYLEMDDIELPERPDFYQGFFSSNHQIDLHNGDDLVDMFDDDDDDDEDYYYDYYDDGFDLHPLRIQQLIEFRIINDSGFDEEIGSRSDDDDDSNDSSSDVNNEVVVQYFGNRRMNGSDIDIDNDDIDNDDGEAEEEEEDAMDSEDNDEADEMEREDNNDDELDQMSNDDDDNGDDDDDDNDDDDDDDDDTDNGDDE